MSTQVLHKIQIIPCSLDEAWNFFSDPANLPAITPPEMKFSIISEKQGLAMYPGQVIEYRVSPFPGISLYWMTEITHVVMRKYFVDEQRFGPYSLWHHQHHFKEVSAGVEMTDIVHWRSPLGFMGDIANSLFVRRRLEQIFTYRFEKVEAIFCRNEKSKVSI